MRLPIIATTLFLAVFTWEAWAADGVPPDVQARFIAGLPVEGTGLQPLAQRSSAWQQHAAEFNKAWDELKKRQLDPIAQWAPTHLTQGNTADGPLFYMFSGPDFLYANTFFPRSPVYVFCGTEPVGVLPDVTTMTDEATAHALTTLRKALNAVLSFSFFITKDMKNDLQESQLTGTVPLLYVFLARQGCQIVEAKLVGLDNNGAFVTGPNPKTPGVRIDFLGKEGRKQSLYYFTTDLSDWGIKQSPGFMKFCESLGNGHAFLKAASYLMHRDHFNTVRDFLLNHARTLVQDDSGIPIRKFPADRWLVNGFGNYTAPIDLFKDMYQPEAAQLFQGAEHEKLPFSFGYRWRSHESSLFYGIALPYVPKAQPVTE